MSKAGGRDRSRSPLGPAALEKLQMAIVEDWRRLEHAPLSCRSDPELICEVTRRSGGQALQFATEELRADREFVLGAAQEIGPALLDHAAAELREDRAFMMEVLEFCPPGEVLRYAGEDLRTELLADRQFVIEATRTAGPELLAEAAPELRRDRAFVLSICDHLPPGEVLEHAADELREELYSDEDFMLQVLRGVGAEVLEYASICLLSNQEFILKAVKYGGADVLEHACEELRANRDFMLAAAQNVGPETPSVLKEMKALDPSVCFDDYWTECSLNGCFWDIEGIMSDYQLICREKGIVLNEDGSQADPVSQSDPVPEVAPKKQDTLGLPCWGTINGRLAGTVGFHESAPLILVTRAQHRTQ